LRGFYFTVICSFISFIAAAQPYGNEWINYSQKYYKVYITAEGIYRLDSLALASSGVNLTGVDPNRFQIFNRSREQAIFVQHDSNGVFNSGEYIEFYGNKNDGHLDSLVYDTADIPNPYYSLYCDTAAYFLTWNLNSTSNLRYAPILDTNFIAFTPDPYFMREELFMSPGQYFYGPRNVLGNYSPAFHATEGWFDTQFQKGDTRTITFNTTNRYLSGSSAQLITKVAGASDDFSQFQFADHQLRIEYSSSSGNITLITDSFNGYQLRSYNVGFPAASMATSTSFYFTSVNNPSWPFNNLSAICFAKFRYPHTPDLEGTSKYMMFVPQSIQPKTFLQTTNFVDGGSPVFLYDMTNKKRFAVSTGPGVHKVLIPNSGNEKQCFMFAENQVVNLSAVNPVTPNAMFTYYGATGYDSAFIIVTHSSFWNEASQYANHRTSPLGGSHHVILTDINQLYDQFAWGIHYNPMAIRTFANLAWDSAVAKPRNLFLIGKSITFPDARDYPPWLAMTLVPSHGHPTTDIMLTSGLNGGGIEPQIPVGRISALTPQDVLDYKDKAVGFDSNPYEEWMKHGLHFGGGGNTQEQLQFASYLQAYENIFEDSLHGGFIHTFLKTSSQPIQMSLSDSVEALINNGITIMTFFGHSSANSFDQNLDIPTNYNNVGKYPLILANSCYSGDFHQEPGVLTASSSEEWTMSPQSGSIGFLASVGAGISYYLDQYSTAFYEEFCRNNYGASIGQCMKALMDSISGDPLQDVANLEMNLQGDPSIVLNAVPLPDYAIADSSVYFTPAGAITADIDSFDIHVVITNLGRAPKDTVFVEIKRIFPDNSSQVYLKPVPFVYYRDTLSIKMPVDKIKGPGVNQFEVWVDAPQRIQEMNEFNNQLSTPALLVILSGDVIPVYPYKYAIIPFDSVTLKACTGNPFEPVHNYRFEIDTTDTYPNPLATTLLSSPGGVMKWKVPMSLNDSTVYYWRVRRDTSDTTNYKWKEFSFQYIAGKRGWEQAHFFQFKNDNFSFIEHDRTNRSFDFIPSGKTLFVDVYGQEPPAFNQYEMYATSYKLDFTVQDYFGCLFWNSLNVVIIDPYTLQPWGTRDSAGSVLYNPTHFYDNSNDLISGGPCSRNRIINYFAFRLDELDDMAGLKRLLVDSVPNGYYILTYSWIHGDFANWIDPSLFATYQNLGSTVSSSQPNAPWIFFTKKGDTASSIEIFGDSMNQFISMNTVLTNNADYGTIYSEVIGPAISWDSLSWRQHALENPALDSVSLSIYGIDNNGVETLLQSMPPSSANVLLSINAQTYPKLRLSVFIQDDSVQTCAQMDKWQVFYQPAPEVAVNPPLGFSFQSSTIPQGDSIRLKIAVQNISEFFMDSMLVTHWVIDQNRVMHPLPSYISKPLAPDSFLMTSITFSTADYPGTNQVWMEINPLNTPQTEKEQYYFNNIAQVGFFTNPDNINPLLDVTFDGVHILNGDIVSAKPDILVQLKDENQFLALNDTADFKLWIQNPGSSTLTRVYFSNVMITFTEALLPDNSCRINLKPLLTVDGVYELLVQAQDRSSNLSGAIDYRIKFEVINKPSITEVMNYPNPFSSSTRFVFTLTGSEVPEDFTIQILTVTGKVVREITREELGNVHIGRNITDYAWDGKDNFGDPLGNGVYFYRVMIRLNNQSIEKRESGADQYFNKGFGKMYLMR